MKGSLADWTLPPNWRWPRGSGTIDPTFLIHPGLRALKRSSTALAYSWVGGRHGVHAVVVGMVMVVESVNGVSPAGVGGADVIVVIW